MLGARSRPTSPTYARAVSGTDREARRTGARRAIDPPVPTQSTTPCDEASRAERDGKIDEARDELEKRDAETPLPAPDPDDKNFRRKKTWWHQHLEPEERRRVIAELGIKRESHWAFRFSVMMSLSIVVAVMGLAANSAAVVIGAMLLAPLMQPVLAAAACIAMALFRKSLQQVGFVFAATIGGVALSYVLARLFVTGDLPQEVLSRTAPDIRDLVVALGAGAAGAYATVRRDVSSSLPGVAVAVALVPPLGAVGVALEAGQNTLARGALLLYTTNLAAIVLAASIVFVVTGFVPPRRLATTFRRTALVSALVFAIVVAIAVPLYQASRTAVDNTDRQLQAREIVDGWLGAVTTTRAPSIQFNGMNIVVDVRSFESPPDQTPLVEQLRLRFGLDVLLEWTRLEQAVVPTTVVVTDEDRLRTQIKTIVDTWLQSGEFDGIRRLDLFTFSDDLVRVDASGVGDAPSVADLTELIADELDRSLEVQLTWLRRENVSAAIPEPTPDEEHQTLPTASTRSPSASSPTRFASASSALPTPRARSPRSRSGHTSATARTAPRRSLASSTWRAPRRRSSSVAHAATSTNWST